MREASVGLVGGGPEVQLKENVEVQEGLSRHLQGPLRWWRVDHQERRPTGSMVGLEIKGENLSVIGPFKTFKAAISVLEMMGVQTVPSTLGGQEGLFLSPNTPRPPSTVTSPNWWMTTDRSLGLNAWALIVCPFPAGGLTGEQPRR